MKPWIEEDWEFEVNITRGEAEECRLGLESGDVFTFRYGCPGGFCPRAMIEIFTWCEVIRCGGDFTYRGCPEKYVMDMECPCRCLGMRLTARPVNRNETGEYTGGVQTEV